ncbi:MAG: hypothetical protein GY842_13525 [bacterium]|nr:hypothetical protein [bacterium]
MRSKLWDQVEQKLRCLRAVSRADVDDAQRFVLAKIVDIYVELKADDEKRFQAELEREANKEVSDMVITWDEALAEREARGEAKGVAKGVHEAIVLVVNHRFGSPPAAFVEALEKIDDLSRLHDLLDQSLTVNSLDELDLDW